MERASYTAGSKGGAYYELRALDGQAIPNQQLVSTLKIAGELYAIDTLYTNEEGKAFIPFELPQQLTKPDALLLVQTRYDGRTESIARSVPIVLDKIALQFMPEGGDIVVGMKNNIAFRAIDERGKPAEVRGRLYNAANELLTDFSTYHDGMGSFELAVAEEDDYYVLLDEPVNNQDTFYLPKVSGKQIGMRLLEQNDNQLTWSIYTQKTQTLVLLGMSNSQQMYQEVIQAKAGYTTVEIPTQDFPIGIAQFTIMDTKNRPYAERLVFMNKDRQINLTLNYDKEEYQPREQVTLDIEAKDTEGNPVEGSFSLAVVDDNLHTYANDHQDNILSGLLLSSELMGDIHKPDFYYDPEEEKADTALDYVMLTHAWLRFTW